MSPGKEPAALIRNLLESQMDFWEICPILVLGKLAGFFDELSKARRPSRELTARRGHVRKRRYTVCVGQKPLGNKGSKYGVVPLKL